MYQARQRYFDRLRIARGIHKRHGFLSQNIGRIFPTWLFGNSKEDEIIHVLAFSELAAAEPGPFDMGDDRAQPTCATPILHCLRPPVSSCSQLHARL